MRNDDDRNETTSPPFGTGPATVTGAALIIPHYNDVIRLDRCLGALAPQMRTDTQVLVVDNGSTEPLDALKARYPDVRFITESGKGAALARNRGVRETDAPWLFFLDADCLPAPDWISVARQIMAEQRPGTDIIGGRIDVFDETPSPRSGAEAFEAVFAFDWRGYIEHKGFTVTANMLTRRDVFEATGEFINGKSEDLDWCRRATAKGYGLQADARLRVGHPSRSDWPALRKKWLRMTREGYGVNGTSGKARLRWGLRALAMPFSALAHAPKILRSDRLADNGERLRGTMTLFRLRLARMVWMLRQAAGQTI